MLDMIESGEHPMNKRTDLDPVDQDHPLGDLGVSEVKEVNKNDN